MKQWFALQREDEVRFFHDGAVEDELAQTEESTKVSSVLDSSDDAASETDTQDVSIGKVTEAQECNGFERAGCDNPHQRRGLAKQAMFFKGLKEVGR